MASETGALTAQLGLASKRHVNHASLTAVHGIEEEGRSRSLDFFSRR
jgi:hypothetical protein